MWLIGVYGCGHFLQVRTGGEGGISGCGIG